MPATHASSAFFASSRLMAIAFFDMGPTFSRGNVQKVHVLPASSLQMILPQFRQFVSCAHPHTEDVRQTHNRPRATIHHASYVPGRGQCPDSCTTSQPLAQVAPHAFSPSVPRQRRAAWPVHRPHPICRRRRGRVGLACLSLA